MKSICYCQKLRYPPAKCNPLTLHSDALRDNACFFSHDSIAVNTYPHHPLMSYFSRGGGVTHFPLASSHQWRYSEWVRSTRFPDLEGIETSFLDRRLAHFFGSTRFPDLEGIETTIGGAQPLNPARSTRFPDLEGIETHRHV